MDFAPVPFSRLLADFQSELNQIPGQAGTKRQLALLSQLSDSGDPAAAPAFVQALDRPELTREAVICLVKLGAAAFDPLLPLLFGPDVRRAALAVLVLAEIGESIRERLAGAFRQANYDLRVVAGTVVPRVDWPLTVEGLSAARLEGTYVERNYRKSNPEAFFRTRLQDVQAVVAQIGAPLVALIAASQLESENVRVAVQRLLTAATWDENLKDPLYEATARGAPKTAAISPRQKRARTWVVIGTVLLFSLCFCLPLLIGIFSD